MFDKMFESTRGGVRGGRDQFKWEDVKEDKHRENYLGNSLMAPVGRWQKNRDLTWYAKKGKEDEKLRMADEIRKIKEAEEDALAEALGYPVKKRQPVEQLDERDLKTILKKGSQNEEEDVVAEADGINGLGYSGINTALSKKDDSTKFMAGDVIPGSEKDDSKPHTNINTPSITQAKIDEHDQKINKDKKEKKDKKSKRSKKNRSDSKEYSSKHYESGSNKYDLNLDRNYYDIRGSKKQASRAIREYSPRRHHDDRTTYSKKDDTRYSYRDEYRRRTYERSYPKRRSPTRDSYYSRK